MIGILKQILILKNNSRFSNKILNYIKNMKNNKPRCIYVFEFEDGYAYVGLTRNLNKRKSEHFNKKQTILKHYLKTNSDFELIQLTPYIEENLAAKLEELFKIHYINQGWNILNVGKCGNLGGSVIIWTFEKVKEDALLYENPITWEKHSAGAIDAARRNGWYKEVTKHMKIQKQKPTGYWNNKETVINDALLYDNLGDWFKNSPGAVYSAKEHGWYNEATKHMNIRVKITKEMCMRSALNYNELVDWRKKYESHVNAARKNGWFVECTAHMIIQNKKINKEECLEVALKYDQINKWKWGDYRTYQGACKHGWLEECTVHMIKRYIIWTKELCLESASKYLILKDWIKFDKNAYQAANKHGWLEECTVHMNKRKMIKMEEYNYEICKIEASKYDNKTIFHNKKPRAWQISKNNGWLDAFFPKTK